MGNAQAIPVLGEVVTTVDSGSRAVAAAACAAVGKTDTAGKLMEGATNSWKEYTEKNIIVGTLNAMHKQSQGQYAAARRIKQKVHSSVEGFVDNVPVVGHVKGVGHYITGDTEHGNKCMIGATRSFAVVGAGALTGGAGLGAVAGGIAGIKAGAIYDITASAVTGEKQGLVQAVDDAIHCDDPNKVLDAGLGVAGDFAVGYMAADAAKSTSKTSKASKSKSSSKVSKGKLKGLKQAKKGTHNVDPIHTTSDTINAVKNMHEHVTNPRIRYEDRASPNVMGSEEIPHGSSCKGKTDTSTQGILFERKGIKPGVQTVEEKGEPAVNSAVLVQAEVMAIIQNVDIDTEGSEEEHKTEIKQEKKHVPDLKASYKDSSNTINLNVEETLATESAKNYFDYELTSDSLTDPWLEIHDSNGEYSCSANKANPNITEQQKSRFEPGLNVNSTIINNDSTEKYGTDTKLIPGVIAAKTITSDCQRINENCDNIVNTKTLESEERSNTMDNSLSECQGNGIDSGPNLIATVAEFQKVDTHDEFSSTKNDTYTNTDTEANVVDITNPVSQNHETDKGNSMSQVSQSQTSHFEKHDNDSEINAQSNVVEIQDLTKQCDTDIISSKESVASGTIVKLDLATANTDNNFQVSVEIKSKYKAEDTLGLEKLFDVSQSTTTANTLYAFSLEAEKPDTGNGTISKENTLETEDVGEHGTVCKCIPIDNSVDTDTLATEKQGICNEINSIDVAMITDLVGHIGLGHLTSEPNTTDTTSVEAKTQHCESKDNISENARSIMDNEMNAVIDELEVAGTYSQEMAKLESDNKSNDTAVDPTNLEKCDAVCHFTSEDNAEDTSTLEDEQLDNDKESKSKESLKRTAEFQMHGAVDQPLFKDTNTLETVKLDLYHEGSFIENVAENLETEMNGSLCERTPATKVADTNFQEIAKPESDNKSKDTAVGTPNLENCDAGQFTSNDNAENTCMFAVEQLDNVADTKSKESTTETTDCLIYCPAVQLLSKANGQGALVLEAVKPEVYNRNNSKENAAGILDIAMNGADGTHAIEEMPTDLQKMSTFGNDNEFIPNDDPTDILDPENHCAPGQLISNNKAGNTFTLESTDSHVNHKHNSEKHDVEIGDHTNGTRFTSKVYLVLRL